MLSFLNRERIVASHGYNRWLIPPAALAVHLSIGQIYAFSVFKNPLVERFDTSLTPVAIIFSIAIAVLGIAAAVLGTWVDRVGPRKAMFTAALCWSGGFLVAAFGVAVEQLWIVYLGYGVLGGIGLGVGYISPVSTLIKWFPDRPGLATGLAIMGFGGGALIASPFSNWLLGTYADDAASAIVPAFITLGLIYLVAMMLGALVVRVPADDWKPEGFEEGKATAEDDMRTSGDVTTATAMHTPQFWLLWTVLFCNVTAGIGILEQASPMIQDFFADIGPEEAAGYVGVLSIANMAGRFIWSSTSDVIGRKPTYMMYLGVGAGLYFLLASLGSTAVALFVATTAIIISFYGGGFATVPAYLKDLFGGLQVGAIHGRLLTAWAAAGIAGPLIVNGLVDLQSGAGKEGPAVYQLSLFIMVGILVVGFIANLMIKPVDERHHVENQEGAGPDGSRAGEDGDGRSATGQDGRQPSESGERATEETTR